MNHLCCVERCWEPGWHLPECAYRTDSDNCRGCLPRQQASGVLICGVHLGALRADLRRIPEVYAELELRLVAEGQGEGERVSSSPDRGLKLNPAAVDARAEIERRLVWWVDAVARPQTLTAPWRGVAAMCSWLANHADWLASHTDYAGPVVEQVREMAWGRPWRVAYPSGSRTVELPDGCPIAGCPGMLSGFMPGYGASWPAVVRCDHDGSHRWTSESWEAVKKASREAA